LQSTEGVGGIMRWNGVTNFAGYGSCRSGTTFKSVADMWCRRMKQGTATSWTKIGGHVGNRYRLNYWVNARTPRTYPSYGCWSVCKCFTNLHCSGGAEKKRKRAAVKERAVKHRRKVVAAEHASKHKHELSVKGSHPSMVARRPLRRTKKKRQRRRRNT